MNIKNKNKPKWKYKLDFSKVRKQLDNKNWINTFKELYNMIQLLKKELESNNETTYLEYLNNWEEDVWVEDKNEPNGICIIKNFDDWKELEFELNNLYDLFDIEKYVWCR